MSRSCWRSSRISRWSVSAQVYPFKKASDRDRYMTGLRLAGVPEA